MAQRLQHPCASWCAARLYGIVETQKLLGNLPENFKVEVTSVSGAVYPPAGAIVLTCLHDRKYVMRRRLRRRR